MTPQVSVREAFEALGFRLDKTDRLGSTALVRHYSNGTLHLITREGDPLAPVSWEDTASVGLYRDGVAEPIAPEFQGPVEDVFREFLCGHGFLV